jgi:hypothetical protein
MKTYSEEQLKEAAEILDRSRGPSFFLSGPCFYASSFVLLEQGADIVALAAVKNALIPGGDGRTYEFLFDNLCCVYPVEFSHAVAAGCIELEYMREALVWSGSWRKAFKATLRKCNRDREAGQRLQ